MGPIRAISTCIRKSLTFSGRATRSEFWWFQALRTLVAIVVVYTLGKLLLAFVILGDDLEIKDVIALLVYYRWPIGLCSALVLVLIPASFSVAARRLHDRSMQAWPLWIVFICATLQLYSYFLFGVVLSISPTYAFSILQSLVQYYIEFITSGLNGDPNSRIWIIPIALFLLASTIFTPIFYIITLIQSFLPSQPDENKYGPNPNEVTP